MSRHSTFKTQVHGLPFTAPTDGAIGAVIKKGEYELGEARCIGLALRPGQVVVDAGANVGYFTVLAAQLVGPQGRVEAFEPDPFNLGLLRTNVQENDFTNVTIHTQALGQKTEKRFLYLSDDNLGDHRTWNDNKEQRPTVAVEVCSLDEKLAYLERIDLLKVDVQGDEVRVLRGAQQLIKRSPGLRLSIEYWPYGLTTNGSSPQEFASLLYDQNFMVSIIDANGLLIPLPQDQLLAIYAHDADQVCNLWCVKGS